MSTVENAVEHAIEIMFDSPRWNELPDAEETVRCAVLAALADCDQDGAAVSVALTGDAEIRELNRRFRAQDKATNVLSFPAPEEPHEETRFLGDIAIAFETVAREAEAEAKPLAHHLAHLAVHGTLHLLEFDHENDADAEAMERRERNILARLGVPDPYAPAPAKRTELA